MLTGFGLSAFLLVLGEDVEVRCGGGTGWVACGLYKDACFTDENPGIMDSVHKTMLTFPGDIVKVALGVCAGQIPAVFENTSEKEKDL